MYAVISFEVYSLVLGVGTLVWMFLVEPSRTPELGQDVLSLWCECFYTLCRQGLFLKFGLSYVCQCVCLSIKFLVASSQNVWNIGSYLKIVIHSIKAEY